MSNSRELSKLAGSYGTGGFTGMKNRIINGAMAIDQRNLGAAVTNINATLYSCDRWGFLGTLSSKFTAQQSNSAPVGFTNSQLYTSLSAYSVTSADWFVFRQRIEGFNVNDLAWGAASAQTISVSFWVKSSIAGTFGGSISNSALNRSYPFSYVINTINTWEYKTVSIPGDTSGTWLTDNNTGIQLSFSLGAGATFSGAAGTWAGANYYSSTGATSIVGTSGATLAITGVQLEKGSTATSFESRFYGTEFRLCQRYYQELYENSVIGNCVSTTGWVSALSFPTFMRTSPTYTRKLSSLTINDTAAAYASTAADTVITSVGGMRIFNSGFTGLTTNRGAYGNGAVLQFQLNAEP